MGYMFGVASGRDFFFNFNFFLKKLSGRDRLRLLKY